MGVGTAASSACCPVCPAVTEVLYRPRPEDHTFASMLSDTTPHREEQRPWATAHIPLYQAMHEISTACPQPLQHCTALKRSPGHKLTRQLQVADHCLQVVAHPSVCLRVLHVVSQEMQAPAPVWKAVQICEQVLLELSLIRCP